MLGTMIRHWAGNVHGIGRDAEWIYWNQQMVSGVMLPYEYLDSLAAHSGGRRRTRHRRLS